jgi:long-subunit acyl-CoA synthetase (AMP-forming)
MLDLDFAGYFNNLQSTKDDEGFLTTGDIGYFDENASLYATDKILRKFHRFSLEQRKLINSF